MNRLELLGQWVDVASLDWPRALALVAALVAAWTVTGRLRLAGALRSTDARKLNHVLAFTTVAGALGTLPPPIARATAVPAGTAIVALAALSCVFPQSAPFRWFVAANTRDDDHPHELLFFWSSWLVSFVALLGLDLLVADVRVVCVAALIVGLADGLAEPVGRRFGRLCYSTPRLAGQRPRRKSVEGSATVLLLSGACVWGSACTSDRWPLVLGVALAVGALAAVVEALTPHGLDNLTLPLSTGVAVSWATPLLWP